MFEYLKGIHKVMLKKLKYYKQGKTTAKVLTMDPEIGSAKEYVRTAFSLCPYSVQ